jgi:hypothetical protein
MKQEIVPSIPGYSDPASWLLTLLICCKNKVSAIHCQFDALEDYFDGLNLTLNSSQQKMSAVDG